MVSRLLIVFFILSKLTYSQDLSSVFLDSIHITVNGEKIAESNTPVLKFVSNTRDTCIKMFDNTTFKFFIRFSAFRGNSYSYLALSGISFSKHDSIIYLPNVAPSLIYDEYCSNSLIENATYRNWGRIDPNQPTKIEVKVHYRLVRLAPIDTLNYRYNYREGLWTCRDYGVEKVLVNYKNDRKDGVAKAIYADGSSFVVMYNKNTSENYERGHFQNMKPLKFTYTLPKIVTYSCNSENRIWHRSFYFTDGKETYDIEHSSDLIVLFQERGLANDSIDYEVGGHFVTIINDTIVIDAVGINIHDFYKKKDDPLHDYIKDIPDQYAKIPLKSILLISHKKKKFFLKPTMKNNKVWKIEYDNYEY